MKNMKKICAMAMCAMLAGTATMGAVADTFDAGRDITVISREEGSGTRGAFVELFGVEQKNAEGKKIDYTTDEAVITNSTAVCMTTVSGKPYAIGYLSLGSLNDTVKALSIDGVTPTVENIESGTYTIARPFNVAVKETLTPVAADFLAYLTSAEGQAVVAANGYIALSDATPYAGSAIAGKVVVAGSSSVTPVMEKLAEAYKAVNPNAEIEVQQSDSTTGVTGAIEGVCDIGMASRALKDSELAQGVTEHTIAKDGIAVIVNQSNPLETLTQEQVRDIYMGEITTWDAVME